MNERSSPEELGSLRNLQFEYAWRYFNLHATQRTTMFNFFIVFSGFFITAFTRLLFEIDKIEIHVLLFLTLVIGIAITLFFIFVERRNEELVHIAEDILAKLEEDIFKNYKFEVKCKKRNFCGWPKEVNEGEIPVGIFNRKVQVESAYRHGRWLPWIEVSLLLIYIMFAIYLLYLLLKKFFPYAELT